jgi:hypothetical protein
MVEMSIHVHVHFRKFTPSVDGLVILIRKSHISVTMWQFKSCEHNNESSGSLYDVELLY